MVYKNLLIRFIFSIILFFIYYLTIKNTYLLLVLVSLIYLIIIYEIYIYFKNYFYLIISYVLISLLCFYFYYFYYFNFYLFNILIFTIIICDSFSYFTGLLFGKNFIFKKISPKKTFEGYLGGVMFTNIIFIIFFISTQENYNFYFLLIFINFVILFSVFGDLTQSFFKRKNNIKNSSTYLPGHGGFFDRFDGFIPSLIFLLFYSL